MKRKTREARGFRLPHADPHPGHHTGPEEGRRAGHDGGLAVALVAHLDSGQTLVTTAGTVPRGISADRMLRVDAGRVEEAA